MSKKKQVSKKKVANVEDEKTKAQFTTRHGSSTTKTTTQGISDTDKDIKEEVK